MPPDAKVLLEPDAGYLKVEDAVRTFIRQAKACGAETRYGSEVIDWSASDQGVVVETTSGRFESDKLVITAGCWASSLLAELNIPLQILRKHLHWFSTKDDRYSESNGCPCFFYGLSDVFIYGFPESASSGLKIALHSGGTTISDPLADDRSEEPAVTGQFRFLPAFSR